LLWQFRDEMDVEKWIDEVSLGENR